MGYKILSMDSENEILFNERDSVCKFCKYEIVFRCRMMNQHIIRLDLCKIMLHQ